MLFIVNHVGSCVEHIPPFQPYNTSMCICFVFKTKQSISARAVAIETQIAFVSRNHSQLIAITWNRKLKQKCAASKHTSITFDAALRKRQTRPIRWTTRARAYNSDARDILY